MHIVTQGIVLREVQYKETDKILTVLAKGQGKVTVKSRGCRREKQPPGGRGASCWSTPK